MELELQRRRLAGYERVMDTALSHEETMEMIVPDACPDILRIVESEGTAEVSGKTAVDGRVEVTGKLHVTVLYQPDGAEGLRKLIVTMPYRCGAEHQAVSPGCPVIASPTVSKADARCLNPRKILVRADLLTPISVWAPVDVEVCTGVGSGTEEDVCTREETHTTYLASAVQEKPFTFTEELELSPSRPGIEELLRHRVELLCGESKIIGNKLIFKGAANLRILYRTASGALCSNTWELPFSQIMEISGAEEGGDCRVSVVTMGCDLSTVRDADSEGRSLVLTMELLAQVAVWEERSVTMLSDAYSTRCPMEIGCKTFALTRRAEENKTTQPVREVLEVEVSPKSVEDVSLRLGQPSIRKGADGTAAHVELGVTVLYCGEDDVPRSVTKTISATCPLTVSDEGMPVCRCRCAPDVQAAPTSEGIEVRVTLEFSYQVLTRYEVSTIDHAKLEEQEAGESEARPSVVLRRVDGGERLWDIAKSYRTTMAEIMGANDLPENTPVSGGQMLLIPRKR